MKKENHREVTSWLIGKRIQKTRQQNQITQSELARALGCTTAYISEIESGSTSANLETLQTICSVLHIQLSELLAYSTPAQDFMMPDFQLLFEQMNPDQKNIWREILAAYVRAAENLKGTQNSDEIF